MGRKKFFKIFLQKYIDFTYEPTFSTVAVSVTGANFLASWRYTEIVGRWTLTSVPFPTVYALTNTTLASALIRAFDSIYLQREDQKQWYDIKFGHLRKSCITLSHTEHSQNFPLYPSSQKHFPQTHSPLSWHILVELRSTHCCILFTDEVSSQSHISPTDSIRMLKGC